MDVLVERVAGLDIGKKIVVVCVRTPGPGGRRVAETRTFPTMTRSLRVMADWLVECGVELAAMESTSTYWKPVLYCLEERMTTWLLNRLERVLQSGCSEFAHMRVDESALRVEEQRCR